MQAVSELHNEHTPLVIVIHGIQLWLVQKYPDAQTALVYLASNRAKLEIVETMAPLEKYVLLGVKAVVVVWTDWIVTSCGFFLQTN